MTARHRARRVAVAGALAASLGLVTAAAAPAGTFYVDGTVAASDDCLSPAKACKTLAAVIPKERGTGEADTVNMAAGVYTETLLLNSALDGGLRIVGAGSGPDPATNTLIENVSGPGPTIEADAPDGSLALRSLRIVAAGIQAGLIATGTPVTIGRGDGPVVVDMQPASNSSPALALTVTGPTPSTLDHVTVTGDWTGNALSTVGNVTVVDSRLTTSATSTAYVATLADPGAVFFQRSIIRSANPADPNYVVRGQDVDVAFDSSEVLGGTGVSTGSSTPGRVLVILNSTIDAGVLGSRDLSTGVSVHAGLLTATMEAAIDGSIVLESLAATHGTDDANITCDDSEVPLTTQARTSSLGNIACAAANHNVFTSSLDALFANPAPEYTLSASSTAVDAVRHTTTALPAGLTASTTDVLGAPRAVNGSGVCGGAAVADRGARELQGHDGTPSAAITAPTSAVQGTSVAFDAGPAAPATTYLWEFSDGGTGVGPSITHIFSAIGPATAKLTATSAGVCSNTATVALTITALGKGLAPEITGLSLTPSAFFAKPSGPTVTTAKAKKRKKTYGTVVKYTGTATATTTFTVLLRKRGRKHGKICAKPGRTNRHGAACTYYSRVGSFTHADATAGPIHFRFMGRVTGRTLQPGSYRLQAVPRNSIGIGKAVATSFTIKR